MKLENFGFPQRQNHSALIRRPGILLARSGGKKDERQKTVLKKLIVRIRIILWIVLLVISNLPPKKNLKLSAVRLRCIFRISWGVFLAAYGGEMRSN